VREIGGPLLTFVQPAATGGLMERRVLFAGGADADFSLLPLDRVAAVAAEAGEVGTGRS
jgi:hypothetical protein